MGLIRFQRDPEGSGWAAGALVAGLFAGMILILLTGLGPLDQSKSPTGEKLYTEEANQRTYERLAELQHQFGQQLDALRTQDREQQEQAMHASNEVVNSLGQLRATRERQMRSFEWANYSTGVDLDGGGREGAARDTRGI